jgi:hypothetical protein
MCAKSRTKQRVRLGCWHYTAALLRKERRRRLAQVVLRVKFVKGWLDFSEVVSTLAGRD